MITPIDSEVTDLITQVQASQPDWGALKILAALRIQHPDWAISEKRFRKIQKIAANPDGSSLIARTGVDASIDVHIIAPKLDVKLFDKGKGKGLVAREKIMQGEVIWQEEPWIATADQ